MEATAKSTKKGGKRRALKRAKAELETRLAEVGAQLAAAGARATALEARNADLAARFASATAEWEAERRRLDEELQSLGEDAGNALADRAAVELRAEEAAAKAHEEAAAQVAVERGRLAIERGRLEVERGQLAVELSQTREALAAALAEVEQLTSHVAQLRAALEDPSRDDALREELGIALAARAAAELRLEAAEKAARDAVTVASERDALRLEAAQMAERSEAARTERETLQVAIAGLQDRLLQSSQELTEAVLGHNRQMAAWYAERETLAAQRDRLAVEAKVRADEADRLQEALAQAAAAADAAVAEIAGLGELAAAREGEIAGLSAAAANLAAKAEKWRRFFAGAAALVDIDAATADDPGEVLECTRRRLRELEMALDRAEVERDRLHADLATHIAAAEARPLRKLHRFLRQLLPGRAPVSASSRG